MAAGEEPPAMPVGSFLGIFYALILPQLSQDGSSNSNSFPDYSRRYLLAQNKEYIAETNGYVYIYWWDCPSLYRTGYLTIDGMKFVIGAAYGNNTNQHHKTVFSL